MIHVAEPLLKPTQYPHLSGCFCHFRSEQSPTRSACLGAAAPNRPRCPWYSGLHRRVGPLHPLRLHWSCWCRWRSPSVHHVGLDDQNALLLISEKKTNQENANIWELKPGEIKMNRRSDVDPKQLENLPSDNVITNIGLMFNGLHSAVHHLYLYFILIYCHLVPTYTHLVQLPVWFITVFPFYCMSTYLSLEISFMMS